MAVLVTWLSIEMRVSRCLLNTKTVQKIIDANDRFKVLELTLIKQMLPSAKRTKKSLAFD
jgi:hypothetical protein